MGISSIIQKACAILPAQDQERAIDRVGKLLLGGEGSWLIWEGQERVLTGWKKGRDRGRLGPWDGWDSGIPRPFGTWGPQIFCGYLINYYQN